eukprot:COSAG06_NODE_13068_length_1297_cov_1.103506_2_plen_20_part_01
MDDTIDRFVPSVSCDDRSIG